MAVLFLASCSKDKENSNVKVEQSSASIKSNQAFRIAAKEGSGTYAYKSDDEYVATVSASGLVKAVRIGVANITVTSDGRTANVKIDVTPVSNLFTEPAMDWGKSRAQIISELGTPWNQNSTTIIYENSIAPIDYIMYGFEDNKLNSVLLLIPNSYISQVKTYLDERYAYAGYENDMTFYFNALTERDITLGLGFYVFDASYSAILYMPFTDGMRSSGRSNDFSMFMPIIEQFKGFEGLN